ncbi:MAG: hypothetical protein AAFY17_08555 [Cyanobacteria bacterium J06642_11]
MNGTFFQLSSGFLTAALVMISATTVSAFPLHLEADAPQVQSMIEEWHWRDSDQ